MDTGIPVSGLTASYSAKEMPVGGSFVFAPTVEPSNAANKTLTFHTGNTKVATVDSNGKVTAVGAGNTWLYATAHNGVQIKVAVQVKAYADTVVLSYSEKSFVVGTGFQITGTLSPEGCYPEEIAYRVGNAAVASVDSEGNVTGLAVGNTWLYAETESGVSTRCLLRVTPIPVEELVCEYETKELPIGGSFTFAPTVLPSNAANKSLTFHVGNIEVATVDSSGNVTADGVGSTWLYATAHNGVQIKVLIRVKEIPVIIILPSNEKNISVGQTTTVIGTLGPDNCYQEVITYRIEDPSIATVDGNGNVTGIAVGETWMYLETETGLSAKCLIRVK